MTTLLDLDADALARHRNVARYGRPVEYRLDSDGSGVAVSLPTPAALASWLTLPGVDAYRRRAALLARPYGSADEPAPVDLPALVGGLRSVLASLPDRRDAEAPYRDLRLAASIPSARFDAYLLGVLRAFRDTLPAVPTRPKARPTAAPLSEKERSRARRKTERDAATAAYETWLARWLPTAESRVYSLAELHRSAVAALAEWQKAGDPDLPASLYVDTEPGWEMPGSRLLARVIDAKMPGTKTRTKRGTAYNLREVAPMEPIFTRSEVLAEVARQERAALARTAASSTEDREYLADVVPLRLVA